MKYLPTICALALCAGACASPDRVDEIFVRIDEINADGVVTPEESEELKGLWLELTGEMRTTADVVMDGVATTIAAQGGIAGVVTGVGLVGLNLWRNRTRRRDIAAVLPTEE